MTKHELAEWLHNNYEEVAKAEKWQTQEITRVKFEDLPAENKSTMLALADRMLTLLILSKREYFAGLAMHGIIVKFCHGKTNDEENKVMAKYAVNAADALLSELSKP